jgi:putative MATE family efflux protein
VPFILFDVAAMSVMRASGDTRTPMIFAALAIALNIVGNYALIFGRLGAPRMGVAGAGLATAAAMVVEGTLMTVWLFTGAARLRLKLASFARVTVASVRRLLAVSLPAATEPLLLQIGFLLFIRMMAELGTGQLAAHRVAVTIESISFMPGWGLGIACGAIVGQQLGAKRPDLALTGLRESLRLALFVMVPLGFVFALFAGPLARAMLDDPASARACAWCLRVAAVEQIAMALAMVLSGGLRGAGDTKSSLVGGMLGVWVIRLPLSYVFAFPLGLGIVGAWIVMIVDWCARAGAFALVWRRGKWKSITL